MKKSIVLVLAGLLFCSSVFAGGAKESTPAAEKGLKIAIVSSPSGVDDGSFNEDNYNGILSFIKKHPTSTVTPVREPTGDSAAAVKAAADIVADYDVLVCTGFQFAGIGELAKENPATKFILVDSYPSDATGNTVELTNVYAMQFAEQESGFFAGMAAALETKTGKVAVVNGIAYPSNVNYQYGFECGVKYVNATEGKTVQMVELPSQAGTDVTGANVGGNYVGSFADESTGKIVGQNLINEGCDIIFVAAGGSGNGVFTAAKESGKAMVIGCDVDQWNDGVNGDKNIILTSVLKVMSLNVDRTLETILNGTFAGGNVLLKADTDSTGYVSEAGHQQLSASTIEKLNAAYPLIQSGKIVPASNFGGFTPDEFVVAK
ncbi:BMP family ABC transporter substrate-binding protein [uncultured Sphaerochaeta sp.]|uniref:BMP family lipoprotein n=1 Tax=uncultured Sphaerochaeta sp. TaxID=886478 RepID=UPI002A0A5695|nr:BMP family ABC transporter substrate-binding protein [uncultured Sphaerochaeta sp.]